MAALARAGWCLTAALFLVISSSILHTDYTGFVPALILLAVIVVCALRPAAGLSLACIVIPSSQAVMAWMLWNGNIAWAEAYACAAIAGLAINAAARPRAGRIPLAIAVPALLFGAVVITAMLASVEVRALTLGPAFTSALVRHVTRTYFVQLAAFPGLHAGMLLFEGVLFFAFAARLASAQPAMVRWIAGAAAIGAALAATANLGRLLQAALRLPEFWPALARLAHTLRWNIEYADYNAAGSYFVLALFLGAGMLIATAARRHWWIAPLVLIGTALWLTGSRAAYVAGVLALGAALAIRWTAGRRRVFAAAALAAVLALGIAVIALASPRRGNQGTSRAAVDIRVQMALVGARMIETRPAFGIGLAEFYQRSGEFITPELFLEFPVSLHENAHDNFVQIAAELGLLGGVPFVWLVGAGLFVLARHARRGAAADPLPLLVMSGLLAFVITWLAGHPLLIPEPSYVFWIVFGAATSASAAMPGPRPRGALWWVAAAAVLAIAASSPLRTRAAVEDAELEHVGIGVSPIWHFADDGTRYRSAGGHATIFVPKTTGFTFSVNPRTSNAVRLELRLDGRLANIVTLAPGRWNDIAFPSRGRTEHGGYTPLDLRVNDGDQTEIWVTKVRALDER